MAANELFDTGIKITGSFSAAGQFPVDGKFVVETIAQRDDHVTQNRAYEGMLVYVKADEKTYQYKKEGWVEFGFNAEDFEGSVYDGLDSDSQILALSARQGKALNTLITNHTSDTTIHVTEDEKTAWNAKADKTTATETEDGLMSFVDKTKLNSIQNNANYYTHPDTHPATMIVEDETHRFVTDDQIEIWDAKPEDKEDIGLGNVTNDAQVKRSEMGVANGVATLDENGKVPSAQLPSYVDDVVERDSFDLLPEEGESDKLYVTTDDNKTYRWSGTQYVAISTDGLALGETSATAYAGDKGKALAESVAAITAGTTTVPSAEDANTVNGFTVEVNVPVDAKFTDTTYDLVTETEDGLMSSEDKVKLDGIDDNANNYTHPEYTSKTSGFYKVAVDNTGHVSETTAVTKDDITGLGIPAQDTVYTHPETHDPSIIAQDSSNRFVTDEQISSWNSKAENTVATISTNGLMSATDKIKLDGIEENANNYVHPDDENTRHVTDSQIATWDTKADKTTATTDSNGLMSKSDKAKLDSIEITKIEQISYTMPASEFASNNKVKIEISDITSESQITIGLDYSSITSEQYEAAALAKFVTKYVDGGIEVSCLGVVPAIDIPVSISVVR